MGKAQILVVEDDRIVAKDIQNSLKNLDFDVCASVPSGEEALEKAEEQRPDLVLMDIMLKSEMNGTEAAEQIRSQFNYRLSTSRLTLMMRYWKVQKKPSRLVILLSHLKKEN